MKATLKSTKFVQKVLSYLSYFKIYTLGRGESSKRKIEKWVKIYGMDKTDKKSLKKLRIDILYSVRRYGIKPCDYFFYDFSRKSDLGRREYMGSKTWVNLMKRLSKGDAGAVFKDKYRCYLKFKDFFKRDVILLHDENDRTTFLDFCKKHERFIIKPQDGLQGDGIKIVDTAKYESLDDMFQKLLSMGELVAEELIVQTNDMAQFHPQSVNTVRAVSIYWEGQSHLVYTSMRIGEGDSIVDNIGAGGMCVAVDTETGVIFSKAIRENPEEAILFHPQTGVQLIGQRLPDWEKLLELVDQLAKVVPEHQIVGWDLAHTEKGWVMVEGNNNPAIYVGQMPAGCGFRAKIESIVGKV